MGAVAYCCSLLCCVILKITDSFFEWSFDGVLLVLLGMLWISLLARVISVYIKEIKIVKVGL